MIAREEAARRDAGRFLFGGFRLLRRMRAEVFAWRRLGVFDETSGCLFTRRGCAPPRRFASLRVSPPIGVRLRSFVACLTPASRFHAGAPAPARPSHRARLETVAKRREECAREWVRIKSARRTARGARKNRPVASPTLTCGTTQNITERDHADARTRERRPSANAAYSQLLLSKPSPRVARSARENGYGSRTRDVRLAGRERTNPWRHQRSRAEPPRTPPSENTLTLARENNDPAPTPCTVQPIAALSELNLARSATRVRTETQTERVTGTLALGLPLSGPTTAKRGIADASCRDAGNGARQTGRTPRPRRAGLRPGGGVRCPHQGRVARL